MSKYFKDPMRIDQLDEIEHWVTQENGTERPGTGKYLNNKKKGTITNMVIVSMKLFHGIPLKKNPILELINK